MGDVMVRPLFVEAVAPPAEVFAHQFQPYLIIERGARSLGPFFTPEGFGDWVGPRCLNTV